MKPLQILLMLSLGAPISPALADGVDTCNALLSGGVFNLRSVNSAWDTYSRINTLYCSSQADTYAKAKSLNIDGQVPIDGILAKFGFGQSENEYSNFRSQLCNSRDQMYANRGWLDSQVQEASGKILNAYSQCVDSLKDGLFMAFQNLSRDSPDFTVEFRNRLSMAVTPEVSVNIPANIDCQDKAGRPMGAAASFKVSGAGLSLACHRRDCNGSVFNVSSSTYAVTPRSLRLPAFHAAPPIPPANAHLEQGAFHPMNGEWVDSPIPNTSEDETCTVVSREGGWNCHYNDPACQHECPTPRVFKNKESSGQYDIDYSDNAGNCRYTFSCVKPTAPVSAPPLPAYCSGALAAGPR
ncbi:MAG: hypothetical protein ACLGI6_03915 [Gammaproteobacteria bacterium]